MSNKYGRALVAVLVVVGVVALTLVLVTRGGAITTQTAPNGVAILVAAGTALDRALPLNTPVSISISETGGGSSGTASIVACSDGTAWSWIGLHGITVGGSYVARGVGVTAGMVPMAYATAVGHRVLTVSAAAGVIRIIAGPTPVRAYINY